MGLWYLKDRDAAWVLGVPHRVVNQRAMRNRQRFPQEFGLRLTRAEADWWFPEPFRHERMRGRPVWAYTLAGLLQLKILGRDPGMDWIRILAADLMTRAAPIPPGLGLPPPPRPAEELYLWAPCFETEEEKLPWGRGLRWPPQRFGRPGDEPRPQNVPLLPPEDLEFDSDDPGPPLDEPCSTPEEAIAWLRGGAG